MNLIKTPSFELSTISQGNPDAAKLAIMIPGRLDTKDYVNFTSHINSLSQRGFYAIAFDPPGTWDSPGDVEYTTTNYIKAVNELIEYFGNRPTLLFGHSRGGQTAMLVGTSHPHVTGLVMVNASYGPPTSPDPKKVVDGFLIERRDIPPGNVRTSEKRDFHLSLDYFKDGAQYDPLPGLKSCTKPKLLIYSTDDEFIEPQKVRDIFMALPEPKMLHELHCAHDYRLDAGAIEEVNEVLGKFIEQL